MDGFVCQVRLPGEPDSTGVRLPSCPRMLNKKLIQALQARDTECWHCGSPEVVPHHRRNRGTGGSKKLDTLDNLLMVCARYNGLMESDAEVAAQARFYGHKLSKFDKTNPPAFDMVRGLWFTLTEGGDKIAAEKEEGLF